ncbi:probable phospholipid-transporting ATPase NEO1 [Zygosaccharomyces bailii ISA1307]|uniref:Phospholipid-transporting ATPase n=1 Tax=Zygosaccharomyces bailii (strain CLIB 213 / ATCC 58445 / CBS 680 / BCRC 21525 / NBRC 1098 / NCYC 1416 / NRRL Y-2227) TaxID=1333698 RepID=A0A8J2T6G9_ZYGB2|nr:BN860_01486g1_1 [Zygosaccharomyces bailii CLIB 213]CDH09106.1 probable phospholipid-transporting ATPase NEO1 [Zygosaccharomyces bailii ISA1307]
MPLSPSRGLGADLNSKFGTSHNKSIDSFDLQFEDNLDRALENLQVRTSTHLERNDRSGQEEGESTESFELRTLNENDRLRDNMGRPSIGGSRPLMSDPWLPESGEVHDSTAASPIMVRHGILSKIISFFNLSPRYRSLSAIELNDSHTEREIHPETTPVYDRNKYPSNEISNAKYNAFTFLPTLLYEQFRFFFNLYFLIVALSQAIPALRIGYLSSYVVPLGFVLTVTMTKEAMDDIQRRRRDNEMNSEPYQVLNKQKLVKSKDLKVGDLIKMSKGDKVPADVVLLQSSEPSGEAFIKTDQLDGETDWKLRVACPLTQNLSQEDLLTKIRITASAPEKSIHKFTGKVNYKENTSNPLSIDNTLWANTVLASSGTCIGCVVYTGTDTRQTMNTTTATVKTGLLELEINSISKILCLCVFALSSTLVLLKGLHNRTWYIDIMRYLILFSSIIPVSLRVNLDLAKSVYAYQIEHDQTIPETVVRTSTIPEDLGRIEYLLSDKTGTLTQNDMQLKKIHLGTVSYTPDTLDIVADCVQSLGSPKNSSGPNTGRRDISTRVRDMVVALALCHNVTPSFEDDELTYQAASPDEIAIVKFTESVGLSLFKRDRHSITLLHEHSGKTFEYKILQIFPFNSDRKRMGIILHDQQKDEYWFFEKGADTVMTKIVEKNDWLDEETGNMAREGLRTLVVGRKKLTQKSYEQFQKKYESASLSMLNRDEQMSNVVAEYLEENLELLGLTGVEDKLQKDVKASIELLRNAGIKIWMLTGDKVETARCVSISAKLISRSQYVHTITKLDKPEGAMNQLEYLRLNTNSCLIIDGESLSVFLTYYRKEFFEVVSHLPTTIACRCTPQQKADVALVIRELTGKRVCCIGDGGNDVSMIQCADVGVGIVGKEGKQASLAADFSITQFCHLTELLLWHGRNSYKRSAKLAQFVMHRGLLISVCQAVYSISSGFEPIALFTGWLMVGYATCYTMAPVFSLTLDHDIDESLTKIYPELYKDLTEGKSLSYKTFFVWVALSLYQGCVIQGFSQKFTSLNELDFFKMVTIGFTALILNELIMVALEIYTWNKMMFISEVATMLLYVVSVPFLGEYFDLKFMSKPLYFGETTFILALSIFPVWAAKAIHRKLNPPSYAKVQEFSIV